MSRRDYPLTNETRAVINGKAGAIAEAMGVADKYVYGIIYGDNPDPFAYLKVIYIACVRAGVDVSAWDASLAEIKAKYRKCDSVRGCVAKLILEEGQTNALIIDALDDGVIDEYEKKPILRAVAAERSTLDILESEIVNDRIAENHTHAVIAVADRPEVKAARNNGRHGAKG